MNSLKLKDTKLIYRRNFQDDGGARWRDLYILKRYIFIPTFIYIKKKIHLHMENLLQKTFKHWQKTPDFQNGKLTSTE